MDRTGKRQRTSNHSEVGKDHIQQLIVDLQHTITSKNRLNILRELLQFVRYDDPSKRGYRCHATTLSQLVKGRCIVQLLCIQLGYMLSRRGASWCYMDIHDSSLEIKLTLTIIDVFYQYCPEMITEELMRNEGIEILRLSKDMLMNNRSFGSEIFLPILSIWHSYSSSTPGTMLLLHHPITLQAISNILSKVQTELPYQEQIIMESLGILKNLSYYGEDYRHRIVDQTNLLTNLTSLSLVDVPNDKAHERLSAVFRNLALSTEVRSRLIQRADVLNAIVRIIINVTIPNEYRNVDESKIDCRKNTLRNILSVVTSLAIDTNTAHLILFHGEGILVEQLENCVIHSEDLVIRKRAVRAFRLLARDPTSAPIMVLQNNKILEILSDRTLNDVSNAVRMEAAEAFAQCACLIRAPMTQHDYILDMLTQMIMFSKTTTTTINIDAIAKAAQEQTACVENRVSIGKRGYLLKGLAYIILNESSSLKAKESICTAFLNLSKEAVNHEVIALPIILDALVLTLIDRGRLNNNSIRNKITELSVRTILNLSGTIINRRVMVKHTTLIQTLIHFAAATTTSESTKKKVKELILQLAVDM